MKTNSNQKTIQLGIGLVIIAVFVNSCGLSSEASSALTTTVAPETAIDLATQTLTRLPTQTPSATHTPAPTKPSTPTSTPTFTQTATPTNTPTPTFASSNLSIEEAWGHVTRDRLNAAFYMMIKNTGPEADSLIDASSSVCAAVYLQDMSDGQGYYPFSVSVPAEGIAELRFLGQRLICQDVSAGVGPGSSVPVILVFEKYGEIEVTVEISDPPA